MSDKSKVTNVLSDFVPFERIDLTTLAQKAGMSRATRKFATYIDELVEEGTLKRRDHGCVQRTMFTLDELSSFLSNLGSCTYVVSPQESQVQLTIAPSSGGHIKALLDFNQAERVGSDLARFNIESFMYKL